MMDILPASKEHITPLTKIAFEIWNEDPKKMKLYFTERLKNKELFVALNDEKIIGYAAIKKNYWEGCHFLDEITVVKDFQKKGVGTALFNKIKEILKKEKGRRLFSSTDEKNIASIRFHKKLGFNKVGFIKDMFIEGNKELIFSIKIK